MRQKIISILEQVLNCTLPDAIDADVDLEQYGMDSLNCIALIVQLEMHFSVVIDDSELLLQSVDTISKIQALLEKSHAEGGERYYAKNSENSI